MRRDEGKVMINDRHRGSRYRGNDHPVLKEDGSQSRSEENIGANTGETGTSTAALSLGFPNLLTVMIIESDDQ